MAVQHTSHVTHHCRLCALAPTGAFEFFGAKEIEVIYAVVSASNNCEMCLSFHAAALGTDSQHTALSRARAPSPP